MNNYLLDKDFLFELNQFQHKEIYARIVVLNYEELPLDEVIGRITTGSVNIDGNSTVRRTCNLTLIAKDINLKDIYWNLGNKFTLEIGIKNFINPSYPEIIWFNQGIFVIASFNSSLTNNNYTISLSGKDKMCLLNGDLGGSLPASIDFGKIDTYDNSYSEVKIEDYSQYVANKYYVKNGEEYILSKEIYNPNTKYYLKNSLLTQEDLTIETIIREAVHTYGKEPYHNIVINDLSKYGLELLEYRGDQPLYLLFNEEAGIYDQMITKDNAENLQIGGSEENPIYLTDSNVVLNSAVEFLNDNRTIFSIPIDYDENGNFIYRNYSATIIEYGHTAGYRETNLTYNGDLISSVGESLTSILDKLKNMLGAFEYFYDIEGRFIFQAKKIYIQNSWNPLQNSDDNVYARDAVEESPYSYSFEDVNLISSFQNTPTLTNLKNDYSVWGVRKGASGAEIPIHSRYAIHKKPVYYKNFDGDIFSTLDLEDIIPTPDKERLPECLREGFEGQWWDIHDWAELYKSMTGEYPTGIMGTYGNRTCKLDLNKYFPRGIGWDPAGELFLFEVAADGTLRDTQHNPGLSGRKPIESCVAHSYTYFIDRAQEGVRSYIYDPTIPANVKIIYNKVDWREIIYQMAKDYYKHNQDLNFAQKIIDNNMKIDNVSSYYPTGQTGYEMFYIDIQGFWRQLYNPDPEIKYDTEGGYYEETKVYEENNVTYRKEFVWKPFLQKQTFTCDYFLKGDVDDENYSTKYYWWNKNVVNAPELLNFWIDFYDADSEIGKYGIDVIGDRPKVINNSKISSIYFRTVPQVIFTNSKEYNPLDIKSGYTYIWLENGAEDLFTISAQGKSAEEETNQLFNQHSYCSESITISLIPIYNIEPNTLIYIHNDENNINGKYQVNRISLPLSFNGMMQIQATKIVDMIT